MITILQADLLKAHIRLMLLCIFLLFSCSKESGSLNECNVASVPLATFGTKSINTDVSDYLVTKDMVQQYLLGLDGYKESIVSISSYPSEANCLLYVACFNEGWKLFPSDSRFGVVLAESEDGTFDVSQQSENENFNVWLANILKQLESARDEIDSFGDKSVQFWNSFKSRNKSSLLKEIDESIMPPTRSLNPGEPIWGKALISTSTSTTIIGNKDHLLQTKWGQDAPWNMSMLVVGSQLCLTGCAAVAVAQVLYYYHNWSGTPSGLYHSIMLSQYNSNLLLDENVPGSGYYQKGILTRSNYFSNSSHWADMPLTNLGGTDEQYRYVSDLMLDVGVRLGMFYSPWLSFININNSSYFDISSCFLSVNWTQFQSSTDAQTVLTGLDMNEPTIITSQGDTQVGHTWVIDGYQKKHYETTKYYAWYPIEAIPDDMLIIEMKNEDYLLSIYPNLYPGMSVVSYSAYDDAFFRMNWGYNGLFDNALYNTAATAEWLDIYSINKGIHYHFFPEELLIQ